MYNIYLTYFCNSTLSKKTKDYCIIIIVEWIQTTTVLCTYHKRHLK